ncbi:serine/threonine protein kinase [Methanothermococcus okinawensis]|uniref:Serine/threonine protein kinase n=1 Tax=Methanothermococcus okinawensis (strain DSM 14208 / JCM 11175 / IH1) TaxID=647113 RepID=F8AN97_METOI|nr:serine/threonine protein kinase [Methanothermococcus okinawensis]AEH06156.1 putative serine/threonine protein kinase [Methanothermococcus okinawensis IH1]
MDINKNNANKYSDICNKYNDKYNNIDNLNAIKKFKNHPIICNLVDWNMLNKILKENNIRLIDFVGKGHRGVVFKGLMDDKLVAIKVPRLGAKNTIYHEGNILKEINKFGVAPIVYNFSEDFLIMEFADGITLKDYMNQNDIDKKELLCIIEETLRQCLRLDLHKIDHTEIQGGKHIIVNRNDNKNINKIYIIDFDKAKKRRAHNFTSAMALFFGKCYMANKVKEILNISEDEERYIMELVKLYKKIVLR